MSGLDGFWAEIDDQLVRMRTAKTAAEVIAILKDPKYVAAHAYANHNAEREDAAFYGGGGGDYSPIDPLTEHAGWKVAWYVARYHYALEAPDGKSWIEYVEGDVYASEKFPRRLP